MVAVSVLGSIMSGLWIVLVSSCWVGVEVKLRSDTVDQHLSLGQQPSKVQSLHRGHSLSVHLHKCMYCAWLWEKIVQSSGLRKANTPMTWAACLRDVKQILQEFTMLNQLFSS